MSFARIWRRLRLVALAGVTACSADPSSPTTSLSPATPDASLLSGLTALKPLQRKTALAADLSVSATIGSYGGRISIPAAGFTLVVPAGAVSQDTRFVVTALKGQAMAYEFQPHGTRFLRPLAAKQDLGDAKGILTLAPLLKAGYFPDRSLIDPSGLRVLVSEILPGITSLGLRTFDWKIDHFSGYIVAW